MNKLIHRLLNVLKEHVNQNNKEILLNQEEIDRLLSDRSGNARKQDIDNKYSVNRELLNENSDFVKMQLDLTEFIGKYEHLFPGIPADIDFKEPEETDVGKLFTQTITGKLTFDSTHPQFNNPKFFKELLKYYEFHEDYEMCEKLLKRRTL